MSLKMANADTSVNVPMSYTVETCVPAKILWEQFKISTKDSRNTWLWPTELSEVTGSGLKPNEQIDVLYKFLFMNHLYSYRLSEIEEGSQFRYTAIQGKHPFIGGALIQINEADSQRQLSWIGQYETKKSQWIARLFFRTYAAKFFKALGRNISEAEKDHCEKNP